MKAGPDCGFAEEDQMAIRTPPFAAFEWMIAWRYLRARRAEGGVSVMTWISLIGITLAVFALIATLAVRAGFRAEFVDTILGANAHVTVYSTPWENETGPDAAHDSRIMTPWPTRLAAVPGVTRAAPLIKGQVMVTAQGRSTGAEVFGIRAADLATIPRIAHPRRQLGDLARFDEGHRDRFGRGARTGRDGRRPDPADLARRRQDGHRHQPARQRL